MLDIRRLSGHVTLVIRCLLLAIMAPAAVAAAAPADTIVRAVVAEGIVAGHGSASGTLFAGLPYAAPPVGALRWAAPAPPAHWRGMRDAISLPPSCPQNVTLAGFAAPSISEDCLYLTVYAPPGPLRGNRPVMVWFPGGGLFAGAGRDYDGRDLAHLGGVVVVTVDYRLGALRFLALPELVGRGEANLGILDQRQSLRWVRRNIKAFGGDPTRVTIFGQSAGADSVLVQLLDPAAHGLFQRAILQSAGFRMKIEPLRQAQKSAAGFAAALGCAGTDLPCLRHRPVDAVLTQQKPFLGGPIVDGKVLPADPVDLVRKGKFNRVPLLLGTTSDEFLWYFAVGASLHKPEDDWTPRQLFEKELGDHADAVETRYGIGAGVGSEFMMSRALSDARFACPAQQLASGAAAYVPIYVYEFGDTTAPSYTLTPGYEQGAGHTAELAYLFHGFHGGSGKPVALNGAQDKLSRLMIMTWANFAREGKVAPGVGLAGTSRWPRYQQGGAALLISPGGDANQLVEPLKRHRCSFWASLLPIEPSS